MATERETRRERRRRNRESRRTQETKKWRTAKLRRLAMWGIPALILAIALGYVLLTAVKGSIAEQVGREMPKEAAQHVPEGTDIQHRTTPPSSGAHYGSSRPWGFYEEEVPSGYWVHNLEHGGIALLYNCPQGCQELVDQIKELPRTFPVSKFGNVKLIVTPYSKMESRLAIAAWGWVDEMEDFDRDRLEKFYITHVDKGPEDVAN